MSTVSVVVPTYNYGKFLPECIESILSQDGPDVRVLILDDASTDETPDIGPALAAQDARLEYRRHRDNQGHVATYNEGVEWADGEYMMLIDADDVLAPGALRRAADLLDTLPQVGFVYGHPVYFQSGNALPPVRTGRHRCKVWPGRRWLELRCRTGTNCVSTQTVVARTELRRRLGGYRPELPHTLDMEVWMKLAAHSDVAYIRGVDQAWQRIHPASLQRTRFSSRLIDLRQRKAAFDHVLREQAEVIADPRRLSMLANRALAREALWRACRSYDRGETQERSLEELIAFALSAYPGAPRLPEWAALRWRREPSARLWPHLQPLLLLAAMRQMRRRLWRTTWRLRGI